MEPMSVNYNFPGFLETELFKFYFTSFRDIDRNIHNLDINITNGKYNRSISSTSYTIQFLCVGSVVEEISIICEYSHDSDAIRITFIKHFERNKLTPYEAKEVYEMKRIGFPRKPFIFTNNIKISFLRIENRDFMIRLTDLETNYSFNAGIIEFNNVSNDRIDIESLVKCVVKTQDNISVDSMKKMMFTLYSPIMNKSQIVTHLTHQYRIAMCMDKKKNIIHFYDIGIVRILFKNNRSCVYSLTSAPKTRMDAHLQINTDSNDNIKTLSELNSDIQTYIFNNYHSVY